ncbi:MAG: glycine--tRNA ligase [Candidatus ainarchaeum sp.]|nr:glycine--tRNA ligase [Candidatus ainarchaeum sp.]
MKEEIMDVALKRGFLIPSNEAYGQVSGFYDYGSVGAPMKRKIEDAWRKSFIWRDGNLEVETVMILPEIVLKASGHVGHFGDPLVGCEKCKKKFRADTLVADAIGEKAGEGGQGEHVKRLKEHLARLPGMNPEELTEKMRELGIGCPECGGGFGEVGWFNLMFKTNIGPVEGNPGYARPETAQGIFLAFPRVFRAHGSRLPLGIGQIGKSFRNEISPRQGLIRLREFTQMELEYFFNPESALHPRFGEVEGRKVRVLTREAQVSGSDEAQEFTAKELVEKKIAPNQIMAYFLARETEFYESLGVPSGDFRFRHMLKEETPHYSGGNFDLEVSTSYGWVETIGTAYRTDFDLSSHAKTSGQDLSVFIEEEKKKIIPHVVEPSFGVDRLFWAVLEKCYRSGGGAEGRDWSWFDFPPRIAPFGCAVLPLMKKDGLKEYAEGLVRALREEGVNALFDVSGSIGKRYARQDEIGTPYCVTADYESLEKGTVTVRFRNDGKQVRVPAGELPARLREFAKAGKVTA